jgi:hypothetical protein
LTHPFPSHIRPICGLTFPRHLAFAYDFLG